MPFLFRNDHVLHHKSTIEHKKQVLICGRHFVTPNLANSQAGQLRVKIPIALKISNRNKNKNIFRLPTLLSSLWYLYFVLYHLL